MFHLSAAENLVSTAPHLQPECDAGEWREGWHVNCIPKLSIVTGHARSGSRRSMMYVQEDHMSSQDPLFGSAQSGESSGDSAKGKAREAEAKAQDAASNAKQKSQQAAGTAKAKADETTDQAQVKADQGMDSAASGLGQAADKLREQGAQQEGTVGTAAAKAADSLDSASGYLRDKDTDQVLNDLEALVRRKPVESLAVAAGVGFVLSKIFR